MLRSSRWRSNYTFDLSPGRRPHQSSSCWTIVLEVKGLRVPDIHTDHRHIVRLRLCKLVSTFISIVQVDNPPGCQSPLTVGSVIRERLQVVSTRLVRQQDLLIVTDEGSDVLLCERLQWRLFVQKHSPQALPFALVDILLQVVQPSAWLLLRIHHLDCPFKRGVVQLVQLDVLQVRNQL